MNAPHPTARCWGIGLSRTGTSSLAAALALLGYRKVGRNPRFEELAGLDAATDLGVVLYYKYLDYKYPGSRFVLTIRDLDSWLPSVEYIIGQYPIGPQGDDVGVVRRMTIYDSVVFDRARYTDAYQRHLQEVRRYFRGRPADLLEMNIVAGDGWDKLCPFLGLPVPPVPFPLKNARPAAVAPRGLE